MKVEDKREVYLDTDTGGVKDRDRYVFEEMESVMKNGARKNPRPTSRRSPHYRSNRISRRTTGNSLQTLHSVVVKDAVVELDFDWWEKTPATASSLTGDMSLFVARG